MQLTLTITDLVRLAVLTGAIILLLALSEILRRRLRLADEFTRKFVHVATGVVIFLAPPYFPNAGAVALIAAVFVLLNAAAYALGVLRAVHHTTRPSFGTVYYPLALLVAAIPFWNSFPDLVVAAILVMAIGDAAAGITGESLRRSHIYHVTGDPKSVEGSAAMLAGSIIALLITFSVYGDVGLRIGALFAAHPLAAGAGMLAVALFATGWEAASSRGLDNLSVPLMTAVALHVCFAAAGSIGGAAGTQNTGAGFVSPGSAGLAAQAEATLRFAAGAGLGVIVAAGAYRTRMLQSSGAVATFLLATVVFGIGGWQWTLPIFAFFLLSSVLSKWRKSQKAAFESLFEKSGTRDAGQVAANGAVVGLLAVAWHFSGSDTLYLLSLVAVAVVTADTWGTEIGILARRQPRSILTFRLVPAGTSGGISIAGTAGGALGALIVTLTALPFVSLDVTRISAITLFGVAGSLIDSLLGATVQAQYRCRVCGKPTEKRIHCAMPAERTRGFRRMTNDAVNLLSTVLAILLATVILLLI